MQWISWRDRILHRSKRIHSHETLKTYVAIEEPRPISRPPGRVYSTNPIVAMVKGSDGQFVLKGPDVRIVFAEACGYELANLLEIDVPEHGLCFVPGESRPYFCCRKVSGRYSLEHWLSTGRITNEDVVSRTIAYDIWIGNHDRNIGNFVEDGSAAGVRIFAIDFEKAAVLRGEPDAFELTTWNGRKFWPVGELTNLCKKYELPEAFCHRIQNITDDQIIGVLENVRMEMGMPSIPWFESASRLLRERRDGIIKLTTEAWHG